MEIDLKQLRFIHGLNQQQMAEILGVTKQQISNIESGKSKLTAKNYFIIEQKFNTNDVKSESQIKVNQENKVQREQIEIKYMEGITDTWRNGEVSSLWCDREMIVNVWHRNPDVLRIISMGGDCMEGGQHPMNNREILIIDTSATDVNKAGIFLFSTSAGLFLCRLLMRINGDIECTYDNPNYENMVLTVADQEKYEFKVFGRVIKNVSWTF